MKYLLSVLLIFTNISISHAVKPIPWEGTSVYPNSSTYLRVPKGLHENGMILSCDIENKNFDKDDLAVIRISDGGPEYSLILYTPLIKDYKFNHKHNPLMEYDYFKIGVRNLDDKAIIKFYNCKSSYY
jgi:hypothetical protein